MSKRKLSVLAQSADKQMDGRMKDEIRRLWQFSTVIWREAKLALLTLGS